MPSEKSVALARRVREVRQELYGEHGGPFLAVDLGAPFGAWSDYEAGVITIPGLMILRFIKVTGACAEWLELGEGPKYALEGGGL